MKKKRRKKERKKEKKRGKKEQSSRRLPPFLFDAVDVVITASHTSSVSFSSDENCQRIVSSTADTQHTSQGDKTSGGGERHYGETASTGAPCACCCPLCLFVRSDSIANATTRACIEKGNSFESGRPNYTRVAELRESSERLREQRQLLVRLFSISSISAVLRVRNWFVVANVFLQPSYLNSILNSRNFFSNHSRLFRIKLAILAWESFKQEMIR